MIVWFTGQPGAGKTTLAHLLAMDGWWVVDGDLLRDVTQNTGYGEAGRRTNIDRAQAIAAFLEAHDYPVAVALVAPYRDQRERFKEQHDLLEVYVHTTEHRGRERFHVDDYEPPLSDFLDIDTSFELPHDSIRHVHRALAAIAQRPRMVDRPETVQRHPGGGGGA